MMATAAPSRSIAATISDVRAPGRNAFACPRSDPNNATPKTLPVCRVELRTPAATPERDFSTLPSKVDVSGGTSNPRPAPIASSCAHIAQ